MRPAGAPRKAIGRRTAGPCWSSAPWSVTSAGPTPPRATRACTTRSSTSGNLFIKCGLSSKSGGPHFSLKKAAFFSKNRLTFLLPAVIIIHVVRATAHGPRRKEYADVAELADALDSGSSSLKRVWVQIPSSAPKACDKKDVTGFFLCCTVKKWRFRQPIFGRGFTVLSNHFRAVFPT